MTRSAGAGIGVGADATGLRSAPGLRQAREHVAGFTDGGRRAGWHAAPGSERREFRMKVEAVAGLLRTAPLFADLDDALLTAVARYGDEARFAAGTVMAREDTFADRFFVVLSGEVALAEHDGEHGPIYVESLGPGDVVGWSWLIPPYRWHFDVRAVQPVHAIAIEAEALRVAMSDEHLGYALMRRFSRVLLERLQATRRRLIEAHEPAAH
jgi:signal-transduction protein with cAMP-binding, CBS, and nucleotidyltransferase domain